MPPGPGAHIELLLPNPRVGEAAKPPVPVPISLATGEPAWLEVYRGVLGETRFYLGAPTHSALNVAFEALRDARPGIGAGSTAACPLSFLPESGGSLLRSVPHVGHHFWPLRLVAESDRGSLLLRSLSSPRFAAARIVVQILFRPTPLWERGFLSPTFEGFAPTQGSRLRHLLDSRNAESPFHVEIRAAASGLDPDQLFSALVPWLYSWSSTGGGLWWVLQPVKPKQDPGLRRAALDHDLWRFTSKKVRRDLSATELCAFLPLPWKERHANVGYAGAPEGRPPREMLVGAANPPALVVGRVGGVEVRLPARWNHLAILGRTRSGKSTLARSVALQILEKQPGARVVVLEPTGTLVRGIVDRLPLPVADDTIEVDPSRASFEEGGVEKVAVPLNLLQLPARGRMEGSELERRVEKFSGDLLQAVKNAWGEESVGGRADFILRSVVQALLAVEGTNLVDAYTVLSDRTALQRLERLSAGGPVRSALRTHLPKLDYGITISSLDKVGKVAENPLLRKTLCQRYGAVPFAELLRHRLLLLNLGKGPLGTEGATFLGAIFLTQLWSALQERTGGEPPVYLVVDEFHNYAIPAFADMLSEGARLGLHVVAVTQYLSRIPEKVRSALVGNVDAWAVFPIGAEDMRDAWKVVQGKKFGWTPEDLVGGLGPHQAAYFAAGALVKLTTPAPSRAPLDAVDPQLAVDPSSRRYARVEDSQASPLAVRPGQLAALIGNLPAEGGAAPEALAAGLTWPPEQVRAAVALGKASGDLAEEPNGQVRLLPRGRLYREAVLAARNEGEEHCGLLADAAAYLEGLGVSVRIGVQERVVPTPDAEFERNGRGYNLEVERSNLVKHVEQVVRNVRKALAARRRCLIVVADREGAERVAGVISSRVPEVEMWEEVGVLWRGGPGCMVPYPAGEREVWGWLLGREETEVDEPVAPLIPRIQPSVGLDAPFQHDAPVVRELAERVRRMGKEWATLQDLLDARVPGAPPGLDERRLGRALASMNVRNRRVRIAGGQIRVYDLTGGAAVGRNNRPCDPGETH